jgi:hypothetical protein
LFKRNLALLRSNELIWKTIQLIPPLQPTVGIDGNLQQIVHLPSPELERWEGVQSENALQHLEAGGQLQPLLM